ncbi:MAG: hypothetical protein HYU28_00530 [Actinobacteria bacterium]|nr:hypothetical protein [Actinomycetota bacterium]
MEPSLIPAIVVGALVFALGVVVLIALAFDRPDPTEVAVAYEEAWDRLDFDTLWRLSAPELRDGRAREEFAAAKGTAYRERADLAGLVGRVEVEGAESAGHAARVRTRLRLRDGTEFGNELRLRRDANRWLVVSYRLGARGGSPAG